MKNKIPKLVLLITAIIIQSCSLESPQSYFGKTALNVNQYVNLGAKDFQQMIDFQSSNSLYIQVDSEFVMSDNFEKHVKTYKIFIIEADIEKIKKLKPTEDTKEMIAASLDVLNFIKSKYETDYIKIAKLLDQKEEKTIIDTAIREFEGQNLDKLAMKLDALHRVALTYAEANDIEVKFF